jgi:hypothetical protein
MSVSWFRDFHDAVFEAHFRAAIVRKRYQVHYDPANRWWNLRETHTPVGPATPYTEQETTNG